MATFRLSIATRDSDEAMSVLNELYSGIDLAPRPESFSLYVSGAGDERFASIQEGMTARGRLRTQPGPSFIVLETTDGIYNSENGRTPIDTSRPALDRQDSGTAYWDGAFSVNATHVDSLALERFASQHFGVSRLRVNFGSSTPVSPIRDRAWLATSAFVRDAVSTDVLLENVLIRDSLFRLLASSLLVTFPNNTLDLGSASDGNVPVPAALRRAVSFMEEHIAASIQLEDIAAAARMSPRGLQDAFLRIFRTTPMTHLRRLRLEAARADLIVADPTQGITVAAIAQRWGFVHLARFSARYREQFGEYSAQTLRT